MKSIKTIKSIGIVLLIILVLLIVYGISSKKNECEYSGQKEYKNPEGNFTWEFSYEYPCSWISYPFRKAHSKSGINVENPEGSAQFGVAFEQEYLFDYDQIIESEIAIDGRKALLRIQDLGDITYATISLISDKHAPTPHLIRYQYKNDSEEEGEVMRILSTVKLESKE